MLKYFPYAHQILGTNLPLALIICYVRATWRPPVGLLKLESIPSFGKGTEARRVCSFSLLEEDQFLGQGW